MKTPKPKTPKDQPDVLASLMPSLVRGPSLPSKPVKAKAKKPGKLVKSKPNPFLKQKP